MERGFKSEFKRIWSAASHNEGHNEDETGVWNQWNEGEGFVYHIQLDETSAPVVDISVEEVVYINLVLVALTHLIHIHSSGMLG